MSTYTDTFIASYGQAPQENYVVLQHLGEKCVMPGKRRMPERWHKRRPMQYVITITRIIGPTIEEHIFDDLTEATLQYEQLVKTTPYERVIIFFFERSALGGKKLIDIHLKEGINYKNTHSSTSTWTSPPTA